MPDVLGRLFQVWGQSVRKCESHVFAVEAFEFEHACV